MKKTKQIIDYVKCPSCGSKFGPEEGFKGGHTFEYVSVEDAMEMVGLIEDFLNGSVGLYEHRRMREIVTQYKK